MEKAAVNQAKPALADYDLSKLNWIRQIDNSDPERPVDTSTAVVGGDLAAGRVDFFSKWEPNSYCPLHRHLGDTISVVLEGEHFIEELDGSRRMRPPGHYACTRAGELHWEHAGAGGSVVFFSLQSPGGGVFEVNDRDGNALAVITLEQLLNGELLSLDDLPLAASR
jgi:quercetin dioxygenase-like cupin family protein